MNNAAVNKNDCKGNIGGFIQVYSEGPTYLCLSEINVQNLINSKELSFLDRIIDFNINNNITNKNENLSTTSYSDVLSVFSLIYVIQSV